MINVKFDQMNRRSISIRPLTDDLCPGRRETDNCPTKREIWTVVQQRESEEERERERDKGKKRKKRKKRKKNRMRMRMILLALGLLFCVNQVSAQNCTTFGELDASFGLNGVASAPPPEYGYYGYYGSSLALQADGKIVVVGSAFFQSSSGFVVVRYTSAGQLDTSFNTNGKVLTQVSANGDDASSVAIQSDGKIVVVGSSGDTKKNFVVVRYTSVGQLDTSFNANGIVITAVSSNQDLASSTVVQADGKIVVAGSSGTTLNWRFAIVRYTSDGQLDTSFNANGIVITVVGDEGRANSVAIQSDGKIVAVGYATVSGNREFAVVRYTSTGQLDTSFNGNGKVVTAIGYSHDYGNSVAIQSDGKIVVAGSAGISGNPGDDIIYNFVVVRYTSTGQLDTSFNNNGKAVTAVSPVGDGGRSVAIQSDDKIVVAGYSDVGGNDLDFAVVRYTSAGQLDPSFNTNGKVITSLGSSHNYATSMAIQSDGKIVVASSHSSEVIRYRCFSTMSPTPNPTSPTPPTMKPTLSPTLRPTRSLQSSSVDSLKSSWGGYASFVVAVVLILLLETTQ